MYMYIRRIGQRIGLIKNKRNITKQGHETHGAIVFVQILNFKL